MKIKKSIHLLLFVVFFSSPVIYSQIKIFSGAKIYTAEEEIFENGVLVINNDSIEFIGNSEDYELPSDALFVDTKGKVIMPGLVDTHSHIGMDWGFDADSPTHPDLRILDAINPFNTTFGRARAGGITTVNIMPGSGHLMSGQTVYVKPVKTTNVEDMLVRNSENPEIYGGLKMANGTNSQRGKPFPSTRGKSAAIIRDLYYQALEYKRKKENAGNDDTKLPSKDIGMETLLEVLEGKRIVHHHTHRADDILTVLRLKKEFGFNVVLHHVSEGWKVAGEIADAKVPCSAIIVDSPGGKLEAAELKFETPRVLADAGVDMAIHTDDWITDSRLFLRFAGLAMRAGLSRGKAIESLTIAGARMLGLDDKIGSLKKGKNADFIILSGDPFSVYTKVEETWINGKKEFDRSSEEDYKLSVGGYKVYPANTHYHNLDGEIHK